MQFRIAAGGLGVSVLTVAARKQSALFA